MQVAIAQPHLGEEETQVALKVLRSGQLTQGRYVAEFERRFAAYHGARHGVATSNGTAALIAALMAHGIGPGDEVIVPAFTFFATASSVLATGARPVFADIARDTFCLAPDAAEAAISSKTKAVLPVHLYGHPADLPRFEQLCAERGLVLLEDAAHAPGAAIGERRVGSRGTTAFSFHATKNMTTTEGGMVLTSDAQVAERLRLIRNQGMSTRCLHQVLGYNLRMTELCGAIGQVQLARLPAWTQQRIANADYYRHHLTRVQTPCTRPGHTHVFHQFAVRVSAGVARDEVVRRLNERGVGARVYYPLPLHQQPVFQAMAEYRDLRLPETERATQEVVCLPVHPHLTEQQRAYVVQEVNAAA